MKKELQAVGTFIILKVVRKDASISGIIIPVTELKGKVASERQDYIEYIEVMSIGEDVTKIKKGDKVIPLGHVFNQTLLMNKIFRGEEFKKNEEYYWCEEKEIVCLTKGV